MNSMTQRLMRNGLVLLEEIKKKNPHRSMSVSSNANYYFLRDETDSWEYSEMIYGGVRFGRKPAILSELSAYFGMLSRINRKRELLMNACLELAMLVLYASICLSSSCS